MNTNIINGWQLTVGLEVHIQLSTKTKMFCKCPSTYGAEPNSLICPICLAMPGALPMINKEAINMAIKLGHALNFNINKENTFARKNYYYPDLPKGYQISQFDKPICENGYLNIDNKNKIGITRAHLEEDSGKLIHHSDKFSFVDLNRAGCPLIEIVSEPELHSSEDAKLYLDKLKQIVKYINISDCDMEKGNLRVDINVSVNRDTDTELGTRREVKNLNSFKSVQKAIDYEYRKQIKMIEEGLVVEQCTLSWSEKNNKTKIIRKKEDAHDYRYFPEPDLPNISLNGRMQSVFIKILVHWCFIGIPVSIFGALFNIGAGNTVYSSILLLPSLLVSTYIFLIFRKSCGTILRSRVINYKVSPTPYGMLS